MNGVQFKALQAAAGLSVRETAAYLSRFSTKPVYASRVQRWRDAAGDDSDIPAWAVERLRARVAELVGPPPEQKD